MKKICLGFGFITIGGAILGIMLAKLEILLGLLGLLGYCMAILGLGILMGVEE